MEAFAEGVEALAGWLFWGSYLLWPILAVLLYAAFRGHWAKRLLAVTLAIPVALLAYARFIEPQRLIRVVTETEICGQGLPGTMKVAVLADMHLGAFRNAPSTARIVKTLNRSEPDLVLIAGDFTYELPAGELDTAFRAFENLQVPAYGVLGNHDNWEGADYRAALIAALEKRGVTMLAPGEDVFRSNGKFLRIVGTRDLESAKAGGLSLGEFSAPDGIPTVVVTHNPDIIREETMGRYDLLVAGHTHGGQVWLPGLTCKLTNACTTLRYGLAETPTGMMFVTSGTGMTALPVRFNMQPRIDFINLRINRCKAEPFTDVLKVFPHDQGAH